MSSDEIFPHIRTIHDLGETLAYEPDISQQLFAVRLGQWSIRFASRAVLLHRDGKHTSIALQSIPHRGVTKLPGGGVKADESLRDSLQREIREETGLAATKLEILGSVIEYRKDWKLVQISNCFTGVVDSLEPQFEPTEPGSSVVWAESSAQALEMLRLAPGMEGNEYDRQFATARDISVIEFLQKNNAI